MLQERDDVVALDSAIIQHPRAWEASGHVAGFTDPMVDCRTCKLRFRADHLERARLRAQAVEASGRDARLRPDRGARVQPDVRDDDRPGRGRRLDRLPAPGDRAGHLPQLQELPPVRRKGRRSGSPRSARASATRSRPATSSSARASSSRWRWSSSCRRTRPSDWFEHWTEQRMNWYMRFGIRPTMLRLRPTRPVSSSTTRAPPATSSTVPDRLVRARGDRQPRRLRPRAARCGLRAEARVRRQRQRGALRPARDRAGGGSRPRAARVPVRRLRRGRDRGRGADRAAPASPARPGEGGGAAARAQGRPAGARRRDLPHAARADAERVRRRRRDRPPLPPPGRDRHAVGGDDRPPVARGPHGDRARPRLARAGADPDRRARPTSSNGGCARTGTHRSSRSPGRGR